MEARATTDEGQAIERQIFGILFDHTSEAVFAVCRTTGVVVAANRRLEELTGRSLAALVGGPASELFAESERVDEEQDWALAVTSRAGLHEDVPIRRLDGYPVFVSLTVALVDHPLGQLAACVARDTTERRLLERELISKHMALYAAHDELEGAVHDLAERNMELSTMGARLSLETRRALIGELSAGIAHSLNNPMGALASAQRQIQIAVEQNGSPELRETVARYLKRSHDSIHRMEQIVQAVRHAHKNGAATSEPRQLQLAAEIDVALSLFESRLGRVRVTRLVDAPGPAWAPPSDLQHVLWNLIDNAILAMRTGGELAFSSRTDGDRLIVAVSDSGAGVPATLKPTLFEPFNSTRATGTGLGLSTSRRLARQWGGDVRLVPSERGACFEIVIPATELACSASESRFPASAS